MIPELASYVVGEHLGSGGFGEVFRARHAVIGRDVAIKVLHAKYSSDPEALARFVAEARAVNQISHPGIVEIFDFGELPDGRAYCVMELIEGKTLREILRERTRLPIAEALPILRAIAEAIDAVHAAGIAHRDLKPDNVFVTATGVKVIDFGLAKLTRTDAAPITETGAVFGTPLYMSPEQCRGKAISAATDAYSFGVLAYHVLVGEPPFGGDAIELALHHVNDAPTPPSKRCKELSRNADQVLLALLAKDPADRPPSLVNATDALAGATTLRARRWKRRARRTALVASSFAVVAIAGVAWTHRATTALEVGCAPAADRLSAVWTPTVRASLAARFASVDRADVAATWRLVGGDLDLYASRWAGQWDGACRAPDRTSDPLLYAQRQNCLERALLDLRGIVESLRRVEPGIFSAGWNGILFESALEDCERVDTLRAMPPAPSPDHRDEVARLENEVQRTRADGRAVFYIDPTRRQEPFTFDSVLARLDTSIIRLDELGAAPAAEAALFHAGFAVGVAELRPGNSDPAKASVTRSIALARKYRDDRVLAASYALQANLELQTTKSIAKIEDSLARADEAEERAGHPLSLGGSWKTRLGLELAVGDPERAIATIQAAQRAPVSVFDRWHSIAASDGLTVLLSGAGRHPEAIAEARRALAVRSDAWHGDHSQVADAHETVMIALYEAGDLPAALDEAHAALAVLERIHAAPTRSYRARLYQTMIAYELGRTDELEQAASAFIAIETNLPFERWLWLATVAHAEARYELGAWALARSTAPSLQIDEERATAAWLRGDLAGIEGPARRAAAGPLSSRLGNASTQRFDVVIDRALVAMADARAGRIAAVDAYLADHSALYDDPDRGSAASLLMFDGYVCISAGDWKRARVLLERADTLATASWVNSSWLNVLAAALGRALLETGDARAAVPMLERALWENRVLAAGEISYYSAFIPDASFALARALWDTGGDRTRARWLAERAISAYGPFRARETEVATRWLETHR